jgi:pyruvate dehydrogenase E2 component (dihydrolipoamide acetyltransferase)
MATDVLMPRLSDSMEEGTVLKWLVKEGAEVKRGEPLVEIETDKANMTYDADTDGTLVEIVAQEGDTLPIGEPIARIGEAGEAKHGKADGAESKSEEESAEAEGDGGEGEGGGAAEGGEQAERDAPEEEGGDGERTGEEEGGDREPAADEDGGAPTGEARADFGGERTEAAAQDGSDGRVKASPVARRMAGELGIKLAAVEGSGPGGRIVKADVEAAAKSGGTQKAGRAPEIEEKDGDREAARETKDRDRPAEPEATPAGEAGAKGELRVQELTRIQQTVSRRMAESKATAPDYQLQMEIDMSACVQLHERLRELASTADPPAAGGGGATPSYNDMAVKACGLALREFPRVNGAYRDGRFELYSRVNVGVAVAAKDTLVVPTIFDADKKSLGEIARDARGLIEKVRQGKITPPEVSGGTFTVSNLGMYGIESFSAIINPPQAALLAIGALKRKAVADDRGRVLARDSMTVTLVCDHRILYGADGAEFLARVRELLESPLALAL